VVLTSGFALKKRKTASSIEIEDMDSDEEKPVEMLEKQSKRNKLMD